MRKIKLGLFSKILIAIVGGVALGWLLGEPKSTSALDESTQEGKFVKAVADGNEQVVNEVLDAGFDANTVTLCQNGIQPASFSLPSFRSRITSGMLV